MNLLHVRGPVMMGDVVYPPGGAFGPRFQRDFQLVVLHEGELDLQLDARKIHLDPGEGILLAPNHREIFDFARGRETRHSWCSIRAAAVPPALRPHLAGLDRPEPFAGRMNVLLEWCRAVANEGEPGVLDGLYLGWGLALLCDFARAARDAAVIRRGGDALARQAQAIGQTYAEPLSLRDLARRSGVSPQHLMKLCRERGMETPMRQLYRKRVEVAAALLLGTGLSISEVAGRCGFLNPFHFSRKFRQAYGRSPLLWRRQSWNLEKKRGSS